MRTILFLLFSCFLWSSAVAQQVEIVEAPHPIILSGNHVSPLLSPDGRTIAFSQQGYKGIYLMNVDGTNIRTLCEHAGAGWGFEWSPDGRYIAARINQFEPDSVRKKTTIEVIDVESGESILVMPFQKSMNIGLPRWSNNVVYFSTRQGIKYNAVQKSSSGKGLKLKKISKPNVRYSTAGEIMMEDRGTKRVLKSPGGREILSAVWSPSGDKIAIEVVGRPSLYIVNSNGSSVTELDAKGERPRWLNDSYVVYMVTEDDGHRLLAGNIYLAKSDVSEKTNLTANLNKIALYPSASPDGKIVFNTEDGMIYVMRIRIPAVQDDSTVK